jgi:hypothetical protein
MATGLVKSSLSEPRKKLLRVLQELNFGRLEGLLVRAGDPVFDPGPRVVREVKFAGENGARPEAELPDFALKAQHRDLFRLLDQMGDGTIATLRVLHGLPFSAEIPG